MPIKWPERKKPKEERDKPVPWKHRFSRVLKDMSATRGSNRKDLRDYKKIGEQRSERFKTPSGTQSYTSRFTKAPISKRRHKRRVSNKRARAARKRNR